MVKDTQLRNMCVFLKTWKCGGAGVVYSLAFVVVVVYCHVVIVFDTYIGVNTDLTFIIEYYHWIKNFQTGAAPLIHKQHDTKIKTEKT